MTTSSRSRWWAIAVTLWLVVALWFVPTLIGQAYDSGHWPGGWSLPKSFRERPLEFYVNQWRVMAVLVVAVGAALAWFVRASRSAEFERRYVRQASPYSIAWARILTFSILLVSALWEHLPSTAMLPDSMLRSMGVIDLIAFIPGFDSFATNPFALGVFQVATIGLIVAALVGWRSRVTVPAAAVAYLVLAGLLRRHAWFYHTGLLPVLVALVLAWLPCADRWSVDAWRRRRKGRPMPAGLAWRYGWARYAVWVVFALPYVMAGLSKLRNGGLSWLGPTNFKFILLYCTVRPMEFDFELSYQLLGAPDIVFVLLALSAVGGEIAFGAVLVSPWGRRVVPAMMFAMHLGILFLQNILFLDLMLLQLVFVDVDRVREFWNRRIRRSGGISEPVSDGSETPASPRDDRRAAARIRSLIVTIVVVLSVCWVGRIEAYPLTGMQMFSKTRGPDITYELVLSNHESGVQRRAPIEDVIPAMSDGRFRRVLRYAFEPKRHDVAEEFFRIVIDGWNEANPGDPIIDIEVQRWRWNFEHDPQSPTHGDMVDVVRFAGSHESDRLLTHESSS